MPEFEDECEAVFTPTFYPYLIFSLIELFYRDFLGKITHRADDHNLIAGVNVCFLKNVTHCFYLCLGDYIHI